jgi:DNA-binding transcriptional ArsR family regulator
VHRLADLAGRFVLSVLVGVGNSLGEEYNRQHTQGEDQHPGTAPYGFSFKSHSAHQYTSPYLLSPGGSRGGTRRSFPSLPSVSKLDLLGVVGASGFEPPSSWSRTNKCFTCRRLRDDFLEWFARTCRDGQQPLSALTRAAVAHLYFESIHPFEDGNGRIGRAIAEKSLAESLGQPTLITLAATILLRRKSYYEALEAANKQNEITNWLAWFAGIAIEAQRRTITLVELLIDKTKQLDRLKGKLNERQTKALLRMFREGPEVFQGGLSAGKYTTITGASPATTTRDLSDLVSKGALTKDGELRHARYRLNVPLRPIRQVSVNEKGEVVEV